MSLPVDAGANADLKARAAARAQQLGLPTRALEDWRYVDCTPLTQVAPASAGTDGGLQPADCADPSQPAAAGATKDLLVVDGRFRTLPTCRQMDAGNPGIETLTDVSQLWALADPGDAVGLAIPAGDQHLTLHSHATGGLSGWHLRLVVAPGATLVLDWEHHGTAASRSSSWLALELGRGASVRLREPGTGDAQVRLSTLTARLEQDARLEILSYSTGGVLLRSRTEIDLVGPGAEVDLASIDLVAGKRQAHRLTRVIHRAANTRSRQAIRAVLSDRAAASCDALIQVLPGADGTDADLQNRNLLLSAEARADTRPQLDIRADDVKAAHGATIGQLDAEELGYLRCRGLDPGAARGLLVGAFVAEILDRIGTPAAGSPP